MHGPRVNGELGRLGTTPKYVVTCIKNMHKQAQRINEERMKQRWESREPRWATEERSPEGEKARN